MNRFRMTSVLAGALLAVSAQAQISSGLVAKYYFTNGNTYNEAGSAIGAVTGATTIVDRFGNSNCAYYFDGVDDKIVFGDSTEFRFAQSDFSISLWVQFSAAQSSVILGKRNDSPTFDQYTVVVGQYPTASNRLGFYHKPSPGGVSGANRSGYTAGDVDSTWHHIAVVQKFSDSTYMFVDGALVASSATAFAAQDSFDVVGAPLTLGFANILGTNHYYNGTIDDIRIYNRALTNAEVDTLFNEVFFVVGVEEVAAASQKIAVFPNPTTSSVQVNGVFDLVLYDVSGRLVKMANAANRLDLSELQAGMYVLAILDEKGLVLQRNKIVKQ